MTSCVGMVPQIVSFSSARGKTAPEASEKSCFLIVKAYGAVIEGNHRLLDPILEVIKNDGDIASVSVEGNQVVVQHNTPRYYDALYRKIMVALWDAGFSSSTSFTYE